MAAKKGAVELEDILKEFGIGLRDVAKGQQKEALKTAEKKVAKMDPKQVRKAAAGAMKELQSLSKKSKALDASVAMGPKRKRKTEKHAYTPALQKEDAEKDRAAEIAKLDAERQYQMIAAGALVPAAIAGAVALRNPSAISAIVSGGNLKDVLARAASHGSKNLGGAQGLGRLKIPSWKGPAARGGQRVKIERVTGPGKGQMKYTTQAKPKAAGQGKITPRKGAGPKVKFEPVKGPGKGQMKYTPQAKAKPAGTGKVAPRKGAGPKVKFEQVTGPNPGKLKFTPQAKPKAAGTGKITPRKGAGKKVEFQQVGGPGKGKMKYTTQPAKAPTPAKQAPLKVTPRQGKKVKFKRPPKGSRADRIAQAEPISKRELERIATEYANRGKLVKRPLTELERIAESYIRKPSPSKLDKLAEAYIRQVPKAKRVKLPSPNILKPKKTRIGELVKKKSAQLSKANLERIAREYLNRGNAARGKRQLTKLEKIAEEYISRPTKSKLDKLAEAYLRHVASKRVAK